MNDNPNEWNTEEYTAAFYANMPEALSDEEKANLQPLIEQACERGIPTLRLIEIVKEGMK